MNSQVEMKKKKKTQQINTTTTGVEAEKLFEFSGT